MPISTGFPRQSLIFCLLLFNVIIFSDRRSAWELILTVTFVLPEIIGDGVVFTSPLWLSFVLYAGFTPEQNGFTQ